MNYPIKKAYGVYDVSVKDQENSALCGKTCNKAHTAAALPSLCSCRCFGSRTSKFSIHCLVLKVSWQKWAESMLFKKSKNKKKKKIKLGRLGEIPSFSPFGSLSVLRGEKKNKKQKLELRNQGWGTGWSYAPSTNAKVVVAHQGRECLTLHHVAAGRFSREIFKGLQQKGWITGCKNQPFATRSCHLGGKMEKKINKN